MASDTVVGTRTTGAGHRPMRLHVPTERSDLRVTWHRADDVFTVTMWHGQECVGSAPLSPPEAANLSAFLVQHLGDRAAARRVTEDAGKAPPHRTLTARLASLRHLLGR